MLVKNGDFSFHGIESNPSKNPRHETNPIFIVFLLVGFPLV